MNLANKITFSRILLVPICVLILSMNTKTTNFISTLIFILACITDALDGYIARKKNLITDLGKFMDPLVDKLLVNSVLLVLIQQKKISCWIVIIIIWRELIVTGFRSLAAKKNLVIAANNLGKAKTISQMLMTVIIMLDIKNNFMYAIKFLFIGITILLTIWSGANYIYKNKDILE